MINDLLFDEKLGDSDSSRNLKGFLEHFPLEVYIKRDKSYPTLLVTKLGLEGRVRNYNLVPLTKQDYGVRLTENSKRIHSLFEVIKRGKLYELRRRNYKYFIHIGFPDDIPYNLLQNR